MSFLSSRRGVFALSALCVLFPLGAPVAAQDTSAAPSSLPAQSPLRQAKTLRVHETFSIAGKEGLHPIFTMNVQIERPGKVHLDMLPEASFYGKNAKASLYVSDGVTQHEYNGLSNKYTSSEAPALGQRATAQICFIADIDLMLSPQGPPTPRTGTTRVVTNTMLDGKPALLTTETEAPRKLPNGSVTPVTKTWIDAATGLPLRRAAYTVQGDKSTINEQLDFTNWEFDKPLPTALFAWSPPQGAEEYNPPRLLAAGMPAPDFAAQTPDGKQVHLSDYRGKPIVIDFWATWCGPCQRSMPHLQKVYEQVKDKGVVVLAVCVWDQKAEYDKWLPLHTKQYTFPTVFDPAGRAAGNIAGDLYKVTGIPTQYVIDKDGKVVAANVGYEGEDDHRLEAALRKIGVEMPVQTAARK